jgi:hypothetical protein
MTIFFLGQKYPLKQLNTKYLHIQPSAQARAGSFSELLIRPKNHSGRRENFRRRPALLEQILLFNTRR